ncbi:LysR family transcriptional regulator [Actinoplanes awajinensis]|uniref:LysR family transcriptional regulator n=1 Tax=Actinoplanes awajinensis subsp. mycoplanecinus TaxID=135947 RepID=A0A0X3V8W6_9ACTN|nr:LysR family transcriptional regulator [Actinoplanes awajinensis]KUL41148.1 LysR family transcriptional regulator [Actinoplanes awajinensis subsp. mycoplanecinus]
MELRLLRYFVATAEAGTVSAAATRLHVTQPGLSRQLRVLERDLGVSLFDRTGRRLELSTTGRVLLPLARDVLGRVDALRVAAGVAAQGRLDRLTIGAPTVTLTDVVSPFIATLAPDDPTTDVLGADGRSPVETLRLGADLAIGTVRAPDPYRSLALAVLPVWAYVNAEHPWASRVSVPLAELLTETLIVQPAAFTARQSLDAAITAAGATCSSSIETANGTVAQALAAAGRGVAVASDDPRFGLVPLPVDIGGRHLSIRLTAVWDSRHAAARTLESFAARLGAFIRDRYHAPAG